MKFTKEQLRQGLHQIAAADIPETVDLCPAIQKQTYRVKRVSPIKTASLFRAAALLIVLALGLAIVPTVRTFAQEILREIGGVKLISEPVPTYEPRPVDESIPTAPPPNVFTLEEVAAMESMTAYYIADVPENYELRERDAARKGETRWIRTSYAWTSPEGEYLTLSLDQTLWGQNLPPQHGEWNMGKGQIEDVVVRGVDGVYVEGAEILYTTQGVEGMNVLIWEEDGFTFTLVADVFTRDELIQIAESVVAAE